MHDSICFARVMLFYDRGLTLAFLLARLYKSTGRAIALHTALVLATAAAVLTKILKFYIKVYKTLYFLNPEMDFVYIWYDYRCWSKIFLGTVHTSAYD